MSRLKIKDHSYVPDDVSLYRSIGESDGLLRDEAISTVAGTEIPNHLRDSILRLVENQAIEAEEQARALAEAHGGGRASWDVDGEQDEDDTRRVRLAGEGDASGDEEAEGDKDKVVDVREVPFRASCLVIQVD